MTTYTNDPAGNRTGQAMPTQSILYTWNAAGHMATAEPLAGTMEFTHNADGQRMAKQSTDASVTGFLFDFKRLLHETDDVGGTITKTFASDTTEEFGDLIGEDGENIQQYDAQANTNALLDSTGSAIEARYKYYAFGLPAAVSLDCSVWSRGAWASLSIDQWAAMTVDDWAGFPSASPQVSMIINHKTLANARAIKFPASDGLRAMRWKPNTRPVPFVVFPS